MTMSRTQLIRENVSFRRLWLGQAVSAFGDRISDVAIPIFIYDLTGSATHLGLAVVVRVLASILFGLIAGVLSDRWDRRVTMVVSDMSRAVLIGLLTIVVFYSSPDRANPLLPGISLTLLYTVNFLSAVASQFFSPARISALSEVVPGNMLLEANSIDQGTTSFITFVGYSVAGFLVTTLGAQTTFIVDSLTFLLSAVFVAGVVLQKRERTEAEREPLRDGVVAGLDVAWSHPVLRALLIVSAVAPFALGATSPLLVIFALEVLEVGRSGYALLMAAFGVGIAVGMFWIGRFATKVFRGTLIIVGVFGIGVAILIMVGVPVFLSRYDWASTSLGVSLIFAVALQFYALGAAANAAILVGIRTLVQVSTPPEMIGRVFNVVSLASSVAMASGAGLAFIGETVPVHSLLIFWSLFLIFSGVFALFLQGLRDPNRVPMRVLLQTFRPLLNPLLLIGGVVLASAVGILLFREYVAVDQMAVDRLPIFWGSFFVGAVLAVGAIFTLVLKGLRDQNRVPARNHVAAIESAAQPQSTQPVAPIAPVGYNETNFATNFSPTGQWMGSELGLRHLILARVSQYYEAVHADKRFTPGETRVNYAGRVYDATEMVNMVDAVLDFWLTAGEWSQKFEKKLGQFLGVRDVLPVNSGSSANLVAVTSLCSNQLDNPLRPGDEVIVPATSFPTTVNPIIQNGLVPVFVDMNYDDFNLDVKQLEAAMSDRTRAIMFAHTLGIPADLDVVTAFVKKHNLYFVEDACDALGSKWDGKMVGTFGDFGTLSCYPAHHITMGEGGAVYTNRPKLAKIARSVRDWGRDCYCGYDSPVNGKCGTRFDREVPGIPGYYDHKYLYSEIGYNLKLTDPQAAMGVAQLDKLSDFIAKRKENYCILKKALHRYEEFLMFPKVHPKADVSWFAFPMVVREDAPFMRHELTRFLEMHKVETRLIFAGNIVRQPAYEHVNARIVSDLDVADGMMRGGFFVGVYPGLDQQRLDYMIGMFEKFFGQL